MDSELGLIRFATLLPIMGFIIKSSMDAWSSSTAISSIIQYSLTTLYLAIVVGLVVKLAQQEKNIISDNPNFKTFFISLGFLLLVYVAIIVLYAIRYPQLQYGFITPTINESINNWIMIPLWLLIFYNMFNFTECHKKGGCPQNVTFYTLAIIAFGLMQLYIVHDSYKMVSLWPTDDIRYYK
jgi:cytochrome c biogenesis factor